MPYVVMIILLLAALASLVLSVTATIEIIREMRGDK